MAMKRKLDSFYKADLNPNPSKLARLDSKNPIITVRFIHRADSTLLTPASTIDSKRRVSKTSQKETYPFWDPVRARSSHC